MKRQQGFVGLLVLALVVVGAGAATAWLFVRQAADKPSTSSQLPTRQSIPLSTETPKLTADVLVGDRSNIWDLAFLPDGKLLFTERKGILSVYGGGAAVSQVAAVGGVKALGEGGLMGLAVDPRFVANRQIYTCMNAVEGDVRVVRWKVTANLDGLTDRKDIVTGITSHPGGRHSGCRLTFGLDGYLWIGTGDSATGPQPQQPDSLNGKVLRVDRDGKGAAGNLGGAFDNRIYSYGHRNIQGIVFFKAARNGIHGLTAEHGSSEDDEVNPLKKGNFGWAPPADSPIGYEERGTPMTDKRQFPDAVDAIWSSGTPTQAPSGLAMLYGAKWKGWDGAIAMAVLKDEHLKVLRIDSRLKVTGEERVLEGTYGRLRAAVLGPDGNLYISTDNKGEDNRIVRLTPR